MSLNLMIHNANTRLVVPKLMKVGPENEHLFKTPS